MRILVTTELLIYVLLDRRTDQQVNNLKYASQMAIPEHLKSLECFSKFIVRVQTYMM